jgi:hypothetical protein
VRRDALAILRRQRGHHARGLPKPGQIRGREQQPHVASASELVQADEPRAQLRARGVLFVLERLNLLIDRVELLRRGGDLLVGAPQFFGFDLAVELQLAQVAEERALLRREPVGFVVQRLQPVGRAARERFGLRAVRFLRRERGADQRNDGQREAAGCVRNAKDYNI